MKLVDHLLSAGFLYLQNKDNLALRSLISEMPTLLTLQQNHRSLLHVAAEIGDPQTLSLLLEMGADPNMRDGEWIEDEKNFNPGYTPLFSAVRASKLEAVKSLIINGADASLCSYDGGSLLHVVSDPEIAQMLIEAGAPLSADCQTRHFDDLLGWHFIGTPLHNVCDSSEMVKLFVLHGADVNALEPFTRRTPLHYASARGLNKTVSALIELGAAVNVIDKTHGYSCCSQRAPIHYAAANGNSDVITLLAQAGANVNSIAEIDQGGTKYRMTALHYAISERNKDAVTVLVKHGAAADVRGSWENQTPKQMAKAADLNFFD